MQSDFMVELSVVEDKRRVENESADDLVAD